MESPSHQPGVGGGGIGQTEGHPDELVLSEWGEGRLLSVRPPHRNGVKGFGPIKGREDPAAGDAGEVVRYVGQWEGVLLGDGVELAVVNSPANLLAVLLGNRDQREGPRGIGFLHHLLFQPSVDLLSQRFLHDRVQRPMLHLDRSRSGENFYMVKDEVGLTISTDRDDVGELEKDTDDFLQQARISLESWGLIQAKLCHHPLDFLFLGKSVELSMCGSFRGRGVVRVECCRRGGDCLNRSHKGPRFQVNIFSFQVVDQHRQAAVGLDLL